MGTMHKFEVIQNSVASFMIYGAGVKYINGCSKTIYCYSDNIIITVDNDTHYSCRHSYL